MAKYHVLGVNNSQGVYQGNPYHNLMLQATWINENPKRDCVGTQVDHIKLKYRDLNETLDLGIDNQEDVEKLPASYFQYLVGKDIKVYYDKYGNPDSVQIMNKPNQGQTTPHAQGNKTI